MDSVANNLSSNIQNALDMSILQDARIHQRRIKKVGERAEAMKFNTGDRDTDIVQRKVMLMGHNSRNKRCRNLVG